MKKLKKISRKELKNITGGGLSDDCFAHFVPGDQIPEDGGYACPCRLVWCPERGSCIHQNMYDPQECQTGL